jgi:hypothetical protein
MPAKQPYHAREGEETSGGYEARIGAQVAFNANRPRRKRVQRRDRRAINSPDAYYNYEGGNPELQMVVGGPHMPSFPQSTQRQALHGIPESHGRSPNGTSQNIRHIQPDPILPIARQFMAVPSAGTNPEGSEARQYNKQDANSEEGQAIERTYQTLRQLRIEFPSIHFTREITRHPKDIEMAINDVISAYKLVYSDIKQLEDRVTTLDTTRESFQPTSKDELARKDQEIFELNEAVREKDKQLLILEGKVSVFTEEFKDANDTRDQKYETRENRIREEHQRDKDALVQGHRLQLTAAEKKACEDMARMKADHTATEQQLRSQLDEMSSRHVQEKCDLERGFSDQTNQSETKHQNEISAMIRDMQQAEAGFKQQIGQLEQESQRKANAIKMMENEHKAEKAKIRAKCEAEKIAHLRGLKETVEILKMDLARRDHFKAMSDRELANRFKEITDEVDDFSRYPWEKDQESSWPFPLRVILSSEKNERVTKQEVMQNTLWVILYKKIFCTPFRVLGEEGKALELEWVKTYGQGELLCGCTVSMTKFVEDKRSNGAAALCPRPTKASEKWRYEAMKECVEATTEPGMDGKANHNVKEGYELTLKEITDALSHELARVALIDRSDKQRMRLLVTKAAQLWLEVGQQRCRMFLLMSNSGREPAQSGPTSLNRDGRMELVVVPEVRRLGNVQGDRLDEDELVSDCKGEFSIFPRR